MHVIDHLDARGFIAQSTDRDALKAALDAGPVVFHAGFDPTGDSLHAGHLLPVLAMAWLQKAGHKPIIILGGGTAMVGDPTGKDKTREILTPADIAHNLACQSKQFGRFVALEGQPGTGAFPTEQSAQPALALDNSTWLCALNYIEFLRDVGRHFSVNRMLTAEGTKQRLERDQGVSFIEFNYHLLQSYDFLELYRRYGCTMQIGGNDQWFNILGGFELIRREHGADAHCFTVPLLMTSDGKKMGKTESGAVWLDGTKLLPYGYYQYFLNVADADVDKLLKLYTFLPLDEIAELSALQGRELRRAKTVLAREATRLAHGEEAARLAELATGFLFGKGKGQDLDADGQRDVLAALEASGAIPTARVAPGTPLLQVFQDAGLAASGSEVRRLVKQGGAKVWSAAVSDVDATLDESAVIWAGKKRAALVLVG